MMKAEIWTCLFLTLPLSNLCQKIECDWGIEYLCGDQCLGLKSICRCDNETILFDDAYDYNCCNQDPCKKDPEGNVLCNGFKSNWRLPCNGTCKQLSRVGWTSIPCQDGSRCVNVLTLCQGVPVCHE